MTRRKQISINADKVKKRLGGSSQGRNKGKAKPSTKVKVRRRGFKVKAKF
jgi:hypothetical protein